MTGPAPLPVTISSAVEGARSLRLGGISLRGENALEKEAEREKAGGRSFNLARSLDLALMLGSLVAFRRLLIDGALDGEESCVRIVSGHMRPERPKWSHARV